MADPTPSSEPGENEIVIGCIVVVVNDQVLVRVLPSASSPLNCAIYEVFEANSWVGKINNDR